MGAIAALGFEPLRVWPLTLLALAGLLALIARAPDKKRAALIGWGFGVGHFTVGNGWIATAFTYQANMPTWLGWIAVVLLSFYLAVYPMLAALAAWSARSRPLALVLAFAGAWIASEWLRSWVFTGYAWNPLAMAALGPFDRPGLAGLAALVGTYGLSGIVALLGGLCWLAVGHRRRPLLAAGILAPVAAAMLLPPAPQAVRPGAVRYTLVQPDVRQEVLDDPAWYEANFRKAAHLSKPHAAGDRLVLWPESGVPDYLRDGYPEYAYLGSTYASDPAIARKRIGLALGPGSLLLTGAVDLVVKGGRIVAAENVITALDAQGTIRGGYAKAHLVPYGEYLALRWLLEPLGATRLVPGSLDFRPGPGPRTLDFGRFGKAGMQICYEIVFSGQVVDRANRPDYIFNPSNDGWFGAWGPPQHLAQARMRAIEEGLPVLRATTTGISAVIAPSGVVQRHVPRHTAGRLDGVIPAADPATPFARYGNMLPLCFSVAFLIASLVALRRRNG